MVFEVLDMIKEATEDQRNLNGREREAGLTEE
jgi:hypothetical protein